MSWRSAFTALAGLAVSGVARSYDLDDLPERLPGADLPALVPAFGAAPHRLGEREEGMAALTYDGGVWRAAISVDHLLVWSPLGTGEGALGALPALIDTLDAYLAALGADGTLGGTLDEPLRITRIEPGALVYGGVRYYGVTFRHRWVRVIGE